MSKAKGTVLIIGAGPRIGHAVAHAFDKEGYRIAVARRNPDIDLASKCGWLAVNMDLSSTESIISGFEKVKTELGIPNVVIYNAAALTVAPGDDPFSTTTETYMEDLQLNLIGAVTALHETNSGFKESRATGKEHLPKVFIATGNVVPFQPLALAVTLGSGKAALAHLMQVGNQAYGEAGYRFYFASQVTEAEGAVPYEDVDGEAHGRKYVELVNRKELGEWDVRFVK